MHGFAQDSKKEKIYEFDYFLHYKWYSSEGGETYNRFILTNSKDNSYRLIFNDGINDDTLQLFFMDFNKLHARTIISKTDLVENEMIDLGCSYSKLVGMYYKLNFLGAYKKVRHFDFKIIKDTLIDSISHKRFQYEYSREIRSKKQKRMRTYTIEPNTDFHLISMGGFVMHKQWDEDNLDVNGIIKEMLHFDKTDNRVLDHMKLVQYSKFNRKVRVNLDCD